MTSSKAIYLRVSKDDLDESKQLVAIKQKFGIEDALILQEKISAYSEEAQERRLVFQDLKRRIVEGEINQVYIFSVERLERNIVRLFEFYFFCEAHNCQIHSVMQDIPNKQHNEKPVQTFLRYINVLLFGYKGQEESYTISYRTKSAIETNDKTTNKFSYQGNKWGKQFKGLDGNNVEMSQKDLEKLQKTILSEIERYESTKRTGYYAKIVDLVAQKYKISISKAYISILKKQLTEVDQ